MTSFIQIEKFFVTIGVEKLEVDIQDVAHNFMKRHQRSNKNTNAINRLF